MALLTLRLLANPLITPQPRVATVAAAMPSPGPVEDDGLFG